MCLAVYTTQLLCFRLTGPFKNQSKSRLCCKSIIQNYSSNFPLKPKVIRFVLPWFYYDFQPKGILLVCNCDLFISPHSTQFCTILCNSTQLGFPSKFSLDNIPQNKLAKFVQNFHEFLCIFHKIFDFIFARIFVQVWFNFRLVKSKFCHFASKDCIFAKKRVRRKGRKFKEVRKNLVQILRILQKFLANKF